MTKIPLPMLAACTPRRKEQTSDDYAADLHRALHSEIGDAAAAKEFFSSTHATPSMRRVAAGIFARLQPGGAANQPAIIRFNSVFGGGKTHTLIALAAAAKHPDLVRAGASGELLPANLAVDDVRLVCYTGENANLLDGTALDGFGRRAKTLFGFLAYQLGGETAFDANREHDRRHSDPGAADIQKLIGDRPTLILIDELIRWVAAAKQLEGPEEQERAVNGLRNSLTTIAKAVVNSPRAVMVITTPEPGHDAYQDETQLVHQAMNNLNSVTARTAEDFTPTETADVPAILRQRLFEHTGASEYRQDVAGIYAAVWRRYNPADAAAYERFHDCYPFHPETLRIIEERLANNNDFQRVRGVLRAMSAIIHNGPEIAEPLLHPHHLDVSIPEVKKELVDRTGHRGLDAAIEADVIGPNATAQRWGPAARKAANVILLGSLAPSANNGLSELEIINGMLSPDEPDNSVATQAVQSIRENGLYIEDDPNAGSIRFNQQSNVRREVEQQANGISETERLEGVRKAIGEAFEDQAGMGWTVFPSIPNNVPDDPSRVYIGIVNPNLVTMQSPDLHENLARLYQYQSGNGGNAIREYRNNVVFLVPEHGDLNDVKLQVARCKAARRLLETGADRLLEYQRNILIQIRDNNRKAVFQSIQRIWINLYYPEPSVQPHGLQPARLQFPDQEGHGQNAIIEFLTGNAVGKMAHPKDPALDAGVWAETGLKNAGTAGMTVGALQQRFTRTPGRKMFLKRGDFERSLWRGQGQNVLVIRTPTGLLLEHGDGPPYRDDLTVWLLEHAPFSGTRSTSTPAAPVPGPIPIENETPSANYIPKFKGSHDTGQVGVSALRARMLSDGLDWSDVAGAALYGTAIGLLDDMASKAQSNAVTASITYDFADNGFELKVAGQTTEQWQQCSRACAQLERAANPASISAEVVISAAGNGADAIRTMLHDLDNTHQMQLHVEFNQPKA